MKLAGFILSCLSMVLLSCDSDSLSGLERVSGRIEQGSFSGQFFRRGPSASPVTAQVNIVLKNGRFSGESSVVKYPAICEGTYSLSNSGVVFSNKCVWTAEFDWTLILDGEFSSLVKGDSLILVKQLGSGIKDEYRLAKHR